MKLSYITRTRWNESRLPFLADGEASLSTQAYCGDSEWLIVSEYPPVSGVLHNLISTIHLTRPGITVHTRKFNPAIRIARGEFIAFMDDDNRKKEGFAEKMVDFIERNDLDGAFCQARCIDGQGVDTGGHLVSTVNFDQAWHSGFYFTDELVVRKTVLCEIGMFDDELKASEDWDLALRLLKHGRIGLVQEPLVDLRQGHDDQVSSPACNPNVVGLAQAALHRILEKHGRLNATCPHCGEAFNDMSYEETHIQWTFPMDTYQRIHYNGETTPDAEGKMWVRNA